MSLAAALLLTLAPAAAVPRVERHELRSPDGLTVVTVDLAEAVRFSVTRRGRAVLLPSGSRPASSTGWWGTSS